MHRLNIGLLLLAGLCAAATLSCNKAQDKKPLAEAGAQIKAENALLKPETPPEPPKEQLAPTDDLTPELHDSLIAKMTAEFKSAGYKVDDATGMVEAGKEGLKPFFIRDLVTAMYVRAATKGDMQNPEFQDRACHDFVAAFDGFVAELQSIPQPRELTKEELAQQEAVRKQVEEQARAQQAATSQAPGDGLAICRQPIGEYRSIREVTDANSSAEVEHNDQYYKYLAFYIKGGTLRQEISEGKIVTETRYPWKYDEKTGTMTLLGPDGSPAYRMVLKTKPGEENTLYVKAPDETLFTVYEKIGDGGREMTEAEMAALHKKFQETKRKYQEEHGGAGGSASEGGDK
jgi:hypothetical protein